MNWTDKIQVYNEDCMETMARYEDNYFDLAIVDPPYGIGEHAQRNHTGDRPTAKWKNAKSNKYKIFNDNNSPTKEYFQELFRVSKNQIIWGANNFTNYLPPSTGWIIWDKKVNEKEHLSMCELAFTSFKIRAFKFEFLWAGFKKQIQEKRIHPTQKPVALYNWILDRYAKPDFKILDTHLGSGSHAISCHHYGCELVAAELDTDYYNDSHKRFILNTAQQKLF